MAGVGFTSDVRLLSVTEPTNDAEKARVPPISLNYASHPSAQRLFDRQ